MGADILCELLVKCPIFLLFSHVFSYFFPIFSCSNFVFSYCFDVLSCYRGSQNAKDSLVTSPAPTTLNVICLFVGRLRSS